MNSTGPCWDECQRLRNVLDSASAVVVGAGAGLSASAGFTYSGSRFQEYFADFIAAYHFTDMYSGGFYSFPTQEEFWAYWSRYIMLNRYSQPPGPVYEELFHLVETKDYFVLTTNVDHCFQRAGFDKSRLFYTQGDFGLWQCSKPCHQSTYGNESAVHRMAAEQVNRRIPSELVPRCPRCGAPMSMNLRADGTFVEDEGWQQAFHRYEEFLESHKSQNLLFLELGVGNNTPGIIKYPFWQMTYQNPNAFYAAVNLDGAYAPPEIQDRSLYISHDIGAVLKKALTR